MARKTLLTEAEIRSFMKLANLTPVGDARLQEWSPPIEEEELPDEEEEEIPLDDAGADLDAAGGDMEMDMDVDVDPEPAADMDMGDADDMGDMGGDKEDQFMDLVQQLADLVGVEVEMDDGEAAADAEMEMGDDVDSLEGGDDLGDEAALDTDLGGDEPEEELPDELEEDEFASFQEGNTEDIVNEVARRVATRLRTEDNKQKMVEELAERIFGRLTNK